MRGDPELNEMARRVIDANHYMTLATLDPDGHPRLSPVYYTASRYTDFYWVSSPEAHHSRNLAAHPQVQIVIFDSTAPVGQAEAVYLLGLAKQIADEELEPVLPVASRTAAGSRPTQSMVAESTPASKPNQPRPDQTPVSQLIT